MGTFGSAAFFLFFCYLEANSDYIKYQLIAYPKGRSKSVTSETVNFTQKTTLPCALNGTMRPTFLENPVS